MKFLVVSTTDSMIWNFLIPHINYWIEKGHTVELACSNTGFYFDELKYKYHLKVYEMPFTRNPVSLKNLRAYVWLNRLVQRHQYDMIISQEPVGGVIGRAVGVRNHLINIYTAHGFHFYKGSPKKMWLCFYPIERFMSRYTDALITINGEDFQRAKTFHAKKVYKLNGIGLNLKKFKEHSDNELKKELGIKGDTFIILTVAEMISRKNYKTALQALARIRDHNFAYIICGDGEKENKLKALAEKLNISDKIIFAGFRKDVSRFYGIADVFLFPSYQEGLSVALMEAMAAGVPIVCSDIRGNRDLIDRNRGGYLLAPDDINGFAKAVKKVMSGDKKSFGEYNQKKIVKYDISQIKEDFYKIIEAEIKKDDEIQRN